MGVIGRSDSDFDEPEISFAKQLEKTLLTADVKVIFINELSEFDKGQLKMLNRIMVEVQTQLIKEIT